MKARIEKTLQNSRCRLCGDIDETINTERVEDETRQDGQGNTLGTMQEI